MSALGELQIGIGDGDLLDRFATLSLRSDVPAENPCCIRHRERQLRLIRETYSAFPVIKDVPCPQCRQWVRIRVYDRGQLAGTG